MILGRQCLEASFNQREIVVRGLLMLVSLCVVVGAVGCAKPGPIQTRRVQPASEDAASNPAAVGDIVNENAKKMGATKKK